MVAPRSFSTSNARSRRVLEPFVNQRKTAALGMLIVLGMIAVIFTLLVALFFVAFRPYAIGALGGMLLTYVYSRMCHRFIQLL
jgi:hypothetical protein